MVADEGSAISDRFALNPFLVRKALYDNGELRDFSQLRGKRVALSGPTTTNRVDIDKVLERGGLTEGDIDLASMGCPDMMANAFKDSVAEDQDWFLRLGLQTARVDIDQLVDNQFVDYALQQLGPYRP